MGFVNGIDVSAYKPQVDWAKVRAQGVRFVFVKASQGIGIVDTSFADHWDGAKRAGLLRGAYHYLVVGQDPVTQAALFVKTVGNDKGELPPILDVEVKYNENASNNQILAVTKIWLDKVEQATGRKPIVYSNYYYFRDHISAPGTGAPPAWANNYPLWIAQYPYHYQDGMMPLQPNGWQDWKFWQYSEQGRLAGITEPNGAPALVDLDFFRGTLDELYAFAGVQQPQPVTYTALAGDTLSSVAKKYGLDVQLLLDANPNLLSAGTKLIIPVPMPTGGTSSTGGDQPVPGPVTYTVKSGDTLTAIAVRFKTTPAALAQLNNLTNPDLIQVGQVLVIPA
jgi:lysozyme